VTIISLVRSYSITTRPGLPCFNLVRHAGTIPASRGRADSRLGEDPRSKLRRYALSGSRSCSGLVWFSRIGFSTAVGNPTKLTSLWQSGKFVDRIFKQGMREPLEFQKVQSRWTHVSAVREITDAPSAVVCVAIIR
jgi:hypothetical protein